MKTSIEHLLIMLVVTDGWVEEELDPETTPVVDVTSSYVAVTLLVELVMVWVVEIVALSMVDVGASYVVSVVDFSVSRWVVEIVALSIVDVGASYVVSVVDFPVSMWVVVAEIDAVDAELVVVFKTVESL